MESVIVLDSSDEEVDVKPPEPKRQKLTATILPQPVKPICSVSPKIVTHTITQAEAGAKAKEIRRITPIKIGERTPVKEKIRHFGDDEEFSPISSPVGSHFSSPDDAATSKSTLKDNQQLREATDEDNNNDGDQEEMAINPTYQELIDICRESEDTPDMEMLIERKLIRYYHAVHPDFVNSKSFCKTVRAVIEDIRANPGLVYLKISSILEELNTRRKSRDIVMVNEEVNPENTGNERRTQQIKKLSRALYVLKKRIEALEETEVDLSSDNDHYSAHIQAELFKKRACQIYEKICDLTGESKTAQRAVRKPIHFTGTKYPEFNRTLQMFVNRTNVFPDWTDVYKCLEVCNKQFGLGLRKDDVRRIAEDAFVKIGRLLQSRRKADLYETVMHFTGSQKDPATEDKELEAKLQENKKHYSKINDLIDSYAKRQESERSETKSKSSGQENLPSTSNSCPETSASRVQSTSADSPAPSSSSTSKESSITKTEAAETAPPDDSEECIIVLDTPSEVATANDPKNQ